MEATTIDALTSLIEQGKPLLDEGNFSKEKMKIWEIQAKRTLAQTHDDEIANEFVRIFGGGMVVRPRMNFYVEYYRPQVARAIDLLETLRTAIIPKLPSAEVKPSAPTSQHFHVNGGNVQIGNGNTVNINNITIGDVITALEKDIEAKAPDSEEKKGVLASLKTITTNETFAAVIGQGLGAFLGQVVK